MRQVAVRNCLRGRKATTEAHWENRLLASTGSILERQLTAEPGTSAGRSLGSQDVPLQHICPFLLKNLPDTLSVSHLRASELSKGDKPPKCQHNPFWQRVHVIRIAALFRPFVLPTSSCWVRCPGTIVRHSRLVLVWLAKRRSPRSPGKL